MRRVLETSSHLLSKLTHHAILPTYTPPRLSKLPIPQWPIPSAPAVPTALPCGTLPSARPARPKINVTATDDPLASAPAAAEAAETTTHRDGAQDRALTNDGASGVGLGIEEAVEVETVSEEA